MGGSCCGRGRCIARMLRRNFIGVEFFEVRSGLGGFGIVRILLEECMVGRFGIGVVVQVAKIDIALGEQSVGAVAAFRIFAAEKFILTDSVVKRFFILARMSFFRKQLGDGEDAGVGPGRGGIIVINRAIKVEDALVVTPGALVFGAGFE